MLENEGITEQIRQAFIAYLLSHPRPIEEILAPRWKDIQNQYDGEFLGMAMRNVTVDELKQAVASAHKVILNSLTENEKRLLVSIYGAEPVWEGTGIEHVQHLPAVNWKLQNIAKMPESKRKASQEILMNILDR